jgi:hypothetical protein
MKSNALALEYQRDYIAARRDLDVLDLVNNPSANGKCSVFGLSFGKKAGYNFLVELGSLSDDAANPFVVAENVG